MQERKSKQGRPGSAYLRDANYYRLGYQLAAQTFHNELHPKAAANGSALSRMLHELAGDACRRRHPEPAKPAFVPEERAREVAERFHRDAEGVVQDLARKRAKRRPPLERLKPRKRDTKSDDRLKRFLANTVIPCLDILVAGALQAEKASEEAERRVEPLRAEAGQARPSLSYRVLYNLACYEAGNGERHLEVAVGYLASALRDAPQDRQRQLASWARDDPSLAPLQKRPDFEELIDRYAEPKPAK